MRSLFAVIVCALCSNLSVFFHINNRVVIVAGAITNNVVYVVCYSACNNNKENNVVGVVFSDYFRELLRNTACSSPFRCARPSVLLYLSARQIQSRDIATHFEGVNPSLISRSVLGHRLDRYERVLSVDSPSAETT